jgi:hypothetical protein
VSGGSRGLVTAEIARIAGPNDRARARLRGGRRLGRPQPQAGARLAQLRRRRIRRFPIGSPEAVRRVLRLVSDWRRMLQNRIRRAGGAFVHSTRELSASAYGFPVELQPSRSVLDAPTTSSHRRRSCTGKARLRLIARHGRYLRRDPWSKRRLYPVRTGARGTRSRADARAGTGSDIPYPWGRGCRDSLEPGLRRASLELCFSSQAAAARRPTRRRSPWRGRLTRGRRRGESR